MIRFVRGIRKKFQKWERHKNRTDLQFVSYENAETMLKQGWTIAPEEDRNRTIGMVWLELKAVPNDR